jgi:hypothetical protein
VRTAQLILLTSMVAACTSGSPTPQQTQPISGASGSATPQQTQPISSRCQEAQPALVSAISTGLDTGLSLRNAKVVKSNDFDNAYFFAADLQGSGLEGPSDVALWVTNRLDGTGSVYAVDAVANEFSDWGDGRTTDSHFSSSDDGADEAKACAAD